MVIETGFDVCTPQQGGRSWQGKNDGKNFRQAGIDYFCDKSVDFARNCKSANITQYKIQYISRNSALPART